MPSNRLPIEELFRTLAITNQVHPLLPKKQWESIHVLTYPRELYANEDRNFRLHELLTANAIYHRNGQNESLPEGKKYRWMLDQRGLERYFHISRGKFYNREMGKMVANGNWSHFEIPKELQKEGKLTGVEGRNEYHATEGNIHLGLDFYTKAGTKVFAPLEGKVVEIIDQWENDSKERPNEGHLNYSYGPVVRLEHNVAGRVFYTIYGHLSRESLKDLHIGKRIGAGEAIGKIGQTHENGGWSPHVHFGLTAPDIKISQENQGENTGSIHRGKITQETLEKFPNHAYLFANMPWFKKIQGRNNVKIQNE
jgi:murein DD-endopeptidase MepM/ murein hydrolase activator NlpD